MLVAPKPPNFHQDILDSFVVLAGGPAGLVGTAPVEMLLRSRILKPTDQDIDVKDWGQPSWRVTGEVSGAALFDTNKSFCSSPGVTCTYSVAGAFDVDIKWDQDNGRYIGQGLSTLESHQSYADKGYSCTFDGSHDLPFEMIGVIHDDDTLALFGYTTATADYGRCYIGQNGPTVYAHGFGTPELDIPAEDGALLRFTDHDPLEGPPSTAQVLNDWTIRLEAIKE